MDIRISETRARAEFARKTQQRGYGPLPPPISLFNHETYCFYLRSETVCYGSEEEEHQSLSYLEAVSKGALPAQYITKFHPSLNARPHPFATITATDALPLEYALPLGTVYYGNTKSATDWSSLRPTPFLAFLHLIDRSLWMVFNLFPVTDEGDYCPISQTEDIEDASFWHDIHLGRKVTVIRRSFPTWLDNAASSTQRLGRTPLGGYDGSTDTEINDSDNYVRKHEKDNQQDECREEESTGENKELDLSHPIPCLATEEEFVGYLAKFSQSDPATQTAAKSTT